jgi:hypothetical protein
MRRTTEDRRWPAETRRRTAEAFAFFVCLALCLARAEARLVPALAGHRLDDTASHPPRLLSRTGLFKDMAAPRLEVSDSIYPYDVNVPLWSDGSAKERFVCVPYGAGIRPTDSAGYGFPDGSVLIKTFSLDTVEGDAATRIRIETRFLVINTFEGYTYFSGLTYRWRRDQSDADLVERKDGEDALIPVRIGGEARARRWRFPSQAECNRCHFPEHRGSLGFITPQLDRPSRQDPSLNQLEDLFRKGVLASNPVQGKPGSFRWRNLEDTGADLEARSRSYLAANCSHCHGNAYGNHSVVSFDYFSPSQPNAYSPDSNYKGYVGAPWTVDERYPQFVYPGRPDSSFVLRRMLARGTFEALNGAQMPPLATYRIDSGAVLLIRDWICGMRNPGTPGNACGLPETEAAPEAPRPTGIRPIGPMDKGARSASGRRKERGHRKGEGGYGRSSDGWHALFGFGPEAFDARGHRVRAPAASGAMEREESGSE